VLTFGAGEVFLEVGTPVATRTEAPPPLDEATQAAFIAKSRALTPLCNTEILRPS
jgi:hypothetical protein